MNLEAIVLEVLNNDIEVIRHANVKELADVDDYFLHDDPDSLIKPIDKGWIVRSKGAEYRIFPNYFKHMQPHIDDQSFIIFNKNGHWINYTTDRVPTNILKNTDVKNAIKKWEITKDLSDNTSDTFKDLL